MLDSVPLFLFQFFLFRSTGSVCNYLDLCPLSASSSKGAAAAVAAAEEEEEEEEEDGDDDDDDDGILRRQKVMVPRRILMRKLKWRIMKVNRTKNMSGSRSIHLYIKISKFLGTSRK